MKKRTFLAYACTGLLSLSMMTACGSSNANKDVVKVGVFLFKFDDTYISTVRQNLSKIEKEQDGKVEFTFYDGKGDQPTQNDAIDTALNKDIDVLMVNLVDTGAAKTVLQKIEDKDKPVVFFNREPMDQTIIKEYDKAIFVGTNAKEAGILQGKMVADLWKKDGDQLDKNKDGKIQYVMLKGEADNPEAVARTKYSIEEIEKQGFDTEQLEMQVCNWDQALAQNAMESWLSKSKDAIELVIANNDGMAQGAIAALQAQGYNTGKDGAKFIPVYGVDATEAAQDLINKKQMSGTVLQDAPAMAKALYETATNLAAGKQATENTDYVFDDTGFAIRIPYQEFTGK